MKLHIGIAGPVATEHVAEFLACESSTLPKGYPGAPLTGVLIGELLKQGHKVSAFTTDSSLYANSELIKASGSNFDLYICPARPNAWRLNTNRLGRIVDGLAYERQQLFNAINMVKPEIIHAHWTYEFALAAIKTGLPHLITCHDAPAAVLRYTRSPYRAIRYLMACRVFQKGRYFTAVSSYIADAVHQYTKMPIDVVPNPIAGYVLSCGHLRSAPVTKRLGLISNGWDAHKNSKPALQAFANIYKAQSSAELHLFGTGFGPGESAQQWCQDQGLSGGMVFHGSIPHTKLIEHLDGLDLLLHPSLEESFGVVIAEAMALGLPIVAGRHSGAVPWVVGIDDLTSKRCCAVLTNVSDPIAITRAIEEAFDQHYHERSVSGFNRARQLFAPDVIAADYMSLYRKIMHKP